MSRGNLSTSLRARTVLHPMQRYDALPADLRHWLAGAVLSWSTRSALRHWRRAMAQAGNCPLAARSRLDAIEARHLARDAIRVWGASHPACGGAQAPGQ
ncbi:DUF6525 family protein [Paracoccus sp. KR1-242]|uniref:DUF6525 family protein n=1 Tax=Paracoccus sp. KR1-242 TaxID=3410028 RepID=UPI003BFFD2F5